MKNGVLKIEKGIPVPVYKPAGRNISEEAALMQKMKAGDSILLQKRLPATHHLARRHIGKGKYAIKDTGNGVRVWRIK